MNILIADDNKTDLLILKKMLTKNGHDVITANNGKEAVNIYKNHFSNIDVVLLDVMMPIMDGKEAAKIIKNNTKDLFIPIIFLSSLTEDYQLAECLDAGGDDFLPKPYNSIVLNAKLRSFSRMNRLHKTVEEQRDKIGLYNQNLLQEQKLAKSLFDNIAHPGCIDAPNIKSVISPMSIFNGDIVLTARNPLGGMYIFVGDFTGHGLPAAVGAMPISEIFYGMTVKGFSMEDILKEINHKLKSILPISVFCCCTMANLNFRNLSAEIWMAGTPDIIIYQPNKKTYTRVGMKNLPLGITNNENMNFSTKMFPLEKDDRIYFWTDGIIEAKNENNEIFNEHRIESFFKEYPDPLYAFETLLNKIKNFTNNEAQTDDFTFLEVKMVDENILGEYFNSKSGNEHNIIAPMDWSFSYEIRTQSLKSFNPLPMITHILMEIPSLKKHNGKLYTILAEIYSNALEHGILELNSSLKNDPKGFSHYYNERNKKLASLKNGKIMFHIDHIPEGQHRGQLIITVTDSGDGFSYQTTASQKNNYSGRGFKILNDLCDEVEYMGNGNIIKVVYNWES